MPSPPSPTPAAATRPWLVAAAQAAGLWAFVVALPVLDVLRAAPEFFVAHRADAWDLVALAGAIVAVVPAAIALAFRTSALAGPRVLDAATVLVVGLLAGTQAALMGYRAGVESVTATAILALAGLAFAVAAWLRWRAFRQLLAWLVVATIAVPAAFLASGDLRGLLGLGRARAGARHASQLAPVVLVVFDELPLVSLMGGDGRIDATRYPHFAALAADGVWFRGATTVSDYTRWALPAILTGRYPEAGSVPTPADHPDSLFTRLAPTHRMEVTEPLTALCPPELDQAAPRPRGEKLARMLGDVRIVAASVFLPPAARAGLPDLTEGWADFGSDGGDFKQVWRAGQRLDPLGVAGAFVHGIDASDAQPTLYFLHTLVSHHPPRRLPSGQAIANFKTPPGMTRGMRWVDAAWPVTLFEQGALVQAGAADAVLGRLRARLEATGLYDRALLVVTADHGISFTPGSPIRGFSDAGAGGIVPVPLIVKLPADRPLLPRGTIDDRNVETIDILPTIADAIGLTPAHGVDGVSALRDRTARPEKLVHFDQARQTRRFTPDAVARLRDAQVARKVATFGAGPWPIPSLGGLGGLVGRPLDSFSIAPAGVLRMQVDDAAALEAVDLAAPLLPVQLKGRLLGLPAGAGASVPLALALNGVVAAVTRPWHPDGRWMALVPPAALRTGANELRVFTVHPSTPGTLTSTTVSATLPPGTNLLSAEAREHGVSQRGFHHAERDATTTFHWTQAEASLTAPVDRSRVPTAIELDILAAGPAGKPLRVRVDGCEILSERLPPGRWTTVVPLGACAPRSDWTTIRLLTETHRPGDRDRRRLGVALARVVLRP